MNVKIKTNTGDSDLWCVECKGEIIIDEKYGVIKEKDRDGEYLKHYHCDCIPEDEDEEIYICEE